MLLYRVFWSGDMKRFLCTLLRSLVVTAKDDTTVSLITLLLHSMEGLQTLRPPRDDVQFLCFPAKFLVPGYALSGWRIYPRQPIDTYRSVLNSLVLDASSKPVL